MYILGIGKDIPAFSYALLLFCVFSLPGTAIAASLAEEDYQRGLASYRAGDVVGAMAPLRRAADAGQAAAQALYGTLLDTAGMSDEAVIYLHLAAEQGDPDGQYGLAKMYLNGDGVETDDGEASRLMRAAAAQGHRLAIVGLALAYVGGNARLGAGDPRHPEAGPLLLQAAELGDVTAMEALSHAYRVGEYGFTPDSARADEWSVRVARIRGNDTKTGGRKK